MNINSSLSPPARKEIVAWWNPFKYLKYRFMGTITEVSTDFPVVALSFDDGPHEEYTPHILDILKKNNAHATFFMVGQEAVKYPDLVRRIYQEGHAIGNHTFHHTALPCMHICQQIKEIWMCRRAIHPYDSHLLRPPWGKQSNGSRLIAFLLGYKVVCWNLLVGDWCTPNPQLMVDRLTTGLRPGTIVLLHDRIFRKFQEEPQTSYQVIIEDRTATIEALDILFQKTTGMFSFVTIPQLLEHGEPRYVHWIRHP